MHDPASTLENDTNKFPWDFDVQTDNPNLGQKSRPYNNQKKKKKKKRKENLLNWEICCTGRLQNKTERV